MRVTLAYRYQGHDPDDTVELPDAEAVQLLRDGWARLPTSSGGAAAGSVDDIKTYVGNDPGRARQALVDEQARRSPRKKLIEHLEQIAATA